LLANAEGHVERFLNHLKDLSSADLCRIARKYAAALGAQHTMHQLGTLKHAQQLRETLVGYLLAFGNVPARDWPTI
jgi:hypothetical protein